MARPDSETPGDRIQGMAMIAVLALGFVLAVMALNTPSARRSLAEASGLAALIEGRTAAAVNHATAHDLPVDLLFREAGGILRWKLFGSGGPQVWVGRHDWLFLIEELRPWPDAEALQATRAALVGRVRQALAAKGIDLVVTLVPDKARMVASELDGPRAAESAGRYQRFLTQLRGEGVTTVDLADTFAASGGGARFYFRTDTHWNQTGAALAARATAAAVTTAFDGHHHFTTQADAAETDGPGDLLRLMSLDRIPDGLPVSLRPAPDRQHVEHTTELDKQAPSGGLLDDGPVIPVALLGSSFSHNSNFDGRLQEALGEEAANFAEDGGGFASSAHGYFTGIAYRQTPPKLVIWEIPERVLGQPLTADDRALLAQFPATP
jgi:alginate O-acetyltransferase complex protein AlgJ